ncbi:aminoglycoside 6'-N-acetyltransferase I [Fontimonas thermophila]|uniref:Aminoglycoside N(6')-acetyltransferase type 1 n=1 Tax=Fontimonas thermophila TaxID=1076937 RepID=A0A1I2I9J0_9GAMM|nr:GNAT family N-acetyltransferase [Fontimonas thermophila]SFF38904.1 aminoglycoside 6'-N-acetyltransferase I [Fontimonas thermophila]
MDLRVVTPELFAQWKRLRDSLYSGLDDAEHEREMNAIARASDQICFVAVADGDQVLGFIELSLRSSVDGCASSPVGYVEGLFVIPKWRRQGIGKALLARAMDWFREAGCTEMAADAEIDDIATQRYWTCVGFEEIWRIVQFRRAL